MASTLFITIDLAICPFVFVYIVCILAYYCKLLYQDLFTTERKSVEHRRNAPAITTSYKLVGYATLTQAIFTTLYIIAVAGVSANQFLDMGTVACHIFQVGNSCITLSKIAIYWIFELRLYLVYGGTKYDRGIYKQTAFTIFLTIYAAFLFAWAVDGAVVQNFDDWKKETGDEECAAVANPYFIILVAIFDVVFNASYVISFLLPIRDVIRNVQGSDLNVHKKTTLSRKMIAVGLKVFILSAVLFVSSLLAAILYSVTGVNFFLIDVCANSTCLMLMTPYYPDQKYFHKLCKCCINCCDRNNYTTAALLAPPKQVEYDKSVTKTQTRTVGTAGSGTTSDVTELTSGSSAMKSTSEPARSVDTNSAVRVGVNYAEGKDMDNQVNPKRNTDESELARAINRKED